MSLVRSRKLFDIWKLSCDYYYYYCVSCDNVFFSFGLANACFIFTLQAHLHTPLFINHWYLIYNSIQEKQQHLFPLIILSKKYSFFLACGIRI